MLTIGFQSQRCRGAQHPRIRHRVLHQTDVASHVGGLHLGDVQVSRVLGNEAPAVLGNKRGEFVKHPAVDDLCKNTRSPPRLERSTSLYARNTVGVSLYRSHLLCQVQGHVTLTASSDCNDNQSILGAESNEIVYEGGQRGDGVVGRNIRDQWETRLNVDSRL